MRRRVVRLAIVLLAVSTGCGGDAARYAPKHAEADATVRNVRQDCVSTSICTEKHGGSQPTAQASSRQLPEHVIPEHVTAVRPWRELTGPTNCPQTTRVPTAAASAGEFGLVYQSSNAIQANKASVERPPWLPIVDARQEDSTPATQTAHDTTAYDKGASVPESAAPLSAGASESAQLSTPEAASEVAKRPKTDDALPFAEHAAPQTHAEDWVPKTSGFMASEFKRLPPTSPAAIDAGEVSGKLATTANQVPAVPPDHEPVSQAASQAPPVVGDHRLPAHLQEAWLQMMREGYALADRGAYFAARREFIRTLYEISQAKDACCGQTFHAAALSRGIRALDEAADFLPSDSSISAPLSTDVLVDPHQTPVVPQLSADLPPNVLLTAYHDYAKQQFAQAVGGVRAGSMALHALGKVYSRLAQCGGEQCRDAVDRAITLQEAALLAHGGNYLAANELGVLVARSGDYPRAEQLFMHSLQLRPSAEADHNLRVARSKQAQSPGATPAASAPEGRVAHRPQIQWLPMDKFVSASDPLAPAVASPTMPYANPQTARSPAENVPWSQPQHARPPEPRLSQQRSGWSLVRGILGIRK